ncbi:hypothetical protein P9112_008098 [Eukaryota sp. TZLM1-RC]
MRSWPNLRTFVRNRILDDVVASVDPKKQWKVLLVDEHMLSVANAVVSPYEIMERGVALVEPLRPKDQRERLAEFEAIYLMCPTSNNVNLLIDDFSSSSPHYNAAHVFFSAPLSDTLLSLLKPSSLVTSRRLKSLKEVPLQFLSFEPNVFLSPSKPQLSSLFPSSSSSSIATLPGINASMEELSTLLSAMGINHPVIRFRKTNNGINNVAASKLAALLNSKKSAGTSDCTVLILDRGMDMVAPLVHEFTYQSNIFDLLTSATTAPSTVTYTGSNGEQRTVFLDDRDEFWIQNRCLHIAEVSERIQELLTSMPQSQSISDQSPKSIVELRSMMSSLPAHQEQVRNAANHLELIGKCFDQFKIEKLESVVGLEQELATGEDEDGNDITSTLARVNSVLNSNNLSMEVIKRLVLLYLVTAERSGGVDFRTKKSLLDDFAKIPQNEQDLFNCVTSFDMTVHSTKKPRRFFRKKVIEESKFAFCRFVPRFRSIIDDFLAGRLDNDHFPTISGVPKKTSKLIVYIIGGVTGSELKVLSDLNVYEQVLVGSTAIVNTNEFLNQLSDLSKNSV